ncbi:S-layer homology domain-containing protein [Desulfoscipio geothermicus DSM 3669]|uniref:S-layer homology domain-containing protein n=1 Tax=Desulfoscipio geothermicus DSM 3669 TaxID=1121426 RepID=A0A1I6E761_9FIRM|nr:S-layer homology domain-containing protein [Desulfoscipio geothermicus DSM 3669]
MGKSRTTSILLGGMLAIAVFTFAVMASPPNALAKGKWKVPPGHMKKMQRVQLVQAGNVTFNIMNDVRGHWAAEPVTAMQKLGIIRGFPDGNFYPRQEVTKSQALVMVMRALGFEGQEPTEESLDLVENSPEWARDTVALALDKGIITRREIKDFAGDLPAQRYEVAVWIARAARGGDIAGGRLTFADAGQIPEYARNYVAYMASNGIMRGYPGNMFRPLHPVQRAEIAAMLFRCQNIYSLNTKFNYLKGEMAEVLPTDPAFIILATGEGTGDSRVMVQVADDAAIFIDGEAAELEDVQEGYTVTVVLNPARKAVMVSARTEDNAVNDDEDEDEEEDKNAPEIDELKPENGDDNVEIGLKTLVVTFDEEIFAAEDEEDIEAGIKVKNETEDEVVDINDVDIDGSKLVIELAEGLKEDSDYSVIIPEGIIEDEDGKEFAGIEAEDWEFTTAEDEDDDAPVIEKLQPGDGDTVDDDVDELTVRFNEEVRWVDEDFDGNKVLVFEMDTNSMVTPDKVVLDGDELTIKFDDELDDGEYSVTIRAGIIEDMSGNKFNGIGVNDWVFEVE